VEIGSLVGCSTSHLALACQQNGQGMVYAVDPHADFSRVDPSLLPTIAPIKQDVLQWTPPEKIDFLFEDGSHEPGFTRAVLEHLAPHLSPEAVVFCHDFHQRSFGAHIGREFASAIQETGRKTGSLLIEPSNCGLGYAVVSPR